ncbi:MAG TPA: histidine utilization repressor [Desulfobacteraceae bacterium]|nr:histidine utilization repressor [Desulfobacteraceae bacterium]
MSFMASPFPLFKRVKNFIEQQIETGRWLPDAKIPSENALVKLLGVSRMTANRALRELAYEGRLKRIQGVGTFVVPVKPQFALLEIKNIAEEIQSHGGAHRSRVCLLREEKPAKDLAHTMGIPGGKKVYHSILVHYDRGVAIQIADRYVNPALAPHFLKQDFTSVTPSEYLCSIAPVTEAEHIIEAMMPDEQMQDLLEIKSTEPCLVLYRTTWVENVIATKNRFIYPGSRYRVGGHFRPASPAKPLMI